MPRFDENFQGPLAGKTVLDLSRLVAGNMVSLQLADYGAEVIKIEPAGKGDPLRHWTTDGVAVSWKVYARNKKSVSLNLRDEAAREMLLALGRDPLVIKATRIDAMHGLVNLMDTALEEAAGFKTPALILYGERDEIIPKTPTRMLPMLRWDARSADTRMASSLSRRIRCRPGSPGTRDSSGRVRRRRWSRSTLSSTTTST